MRGRHIPGWQPCPGGTLKTSTPILERRKRYVCPTCDALIVITKSDIKPEPADHYYPGPNQ